MLRALLMGLLPARPRPPGQATDRIRPGPPRSTDLAGRGFAIVACGCLAASTLLQGPAPAQVAAGDSFTARDTLAPPPDDDDDARRCLADIAWRPDAFAIRVDEGRPERGEFAVRFPSPRPDGDAVNDEVALEWHRPAPTADATPVPACVVVHESGGGMTVGRMIARGLAARGVHAGMIHLPHYGLRRRQGAATRPESLLRSVRQAVADVRRARDAMAALPGVDGGRIGVQGTSLGGFVAATAAALDDGFAATFLLLSGGDIAGVLESGARDAARVRESLVAAGMSPGQIRDTVWAIEPLRLAHRLAPDRTWLYSGLHDDVVPPRHPRLLATAARLSAGHHVELHADHYTGIIYLPLVLTQIGGHLRDVGPTPAGPGAEGDP